MLVSRKDLASVLDKFRGNGPYALDTETTGLRTYLGDRLFSLILSDHSAAYYFNFQSYESVGDDWVLPREETFQALQELFSNPGATWYVHNAKFDLGMLANEGVEIAGRIHDTEVGGRLQYNRYLSYSLGNLTKLIGAEKSSEVDEYIKKHKCWTWLTSPGKTKRAKHPHYDRVPFPIISKYGEQDGRITHQLGTHQAQEFQRISTIIPQGNFHQLVETEFQLTKTCLAMERVGVKIDRAYCQAAYNYEKQVADAAASRFENLSGVDFVDSGKSLAQAFDTVGEAYPKTAKGNPSFTDEVLEGFTSPLANIVQEYRSASKKANTYYANFLYFADSQDRIHPNMRQAGTDTGRFSYADPNLQNIPKEEDGTWKVRRAFVPSGPDWCLVMIDYDQMEYRLMLDYAGQLDVIRKILVEGLDVHQATGEMMGVTRTAAKTLNFMLLYGGGTAKLAAALSMTLDEATRLKRLYFSQLSKIREFTRRVTDTAEARGFVFNWAGRVCHFPLMPSKDGPSRYAYRAPNHLIQGGCADIVKKAMNGLQDFLKPYASRMLLQVHDEVVFEVHRSELDIVPELRKIMEAAYPSKHLPLTCGVEHSWKSWADKEKGCP